MGDDLVSRKAVMDLIVDGECYTVDELMAGVAALPAAPADDVRAGALREAVEAVNKAREAVIHSGNRAYIDGISVGHDRAERAILALIAEAKP